jgi:hypothetical protein
MGRRRAEKSGAEEEMNPKTARDIKIGEELEAMARTAGWKIVDEYIQDQIAARLKDLERTEFDNLARVARLQGEIAGLRAITIFLQDRLRRYREALQKGE